MKNSRILAARPSQLKQSQELEKQESGLFDDRQSQEKQTDVLLQDSKIDIKMGLIECGIAKLKWIDAKSSSTLESSFKIHKQIIQILNVEALRFLDLNAYHDALQLLEASRDMIVAHQDPKHIPSISSQKPTSNQKNNHKNSKYLQPPTKNAAAATAATSQVKSNELLAYTLCNQGVCLRRMGRPSCSLDVLLEALAASKQTPNQALQGNIHLNLAILSSQLGLHDRAIDFAKKALIQTQVSIASAAAANRDSSKQLRQGSIPDLMIPPARIIANIGVGESPEEQKIAHELLCYRTLAHEEAIIGNFPAAHRNYECALNLAKDQRLKSGDKDNNYLNPIEGILEDEFNLFKSNVIAADSVKSFQNQPMSPRSYSSFREKVAAELNAAAAAAVGDDIQRQPSNHKLHETDMTKQKEKLINEKYRIYEPKKYPLHLSQKTSQPKPEHASTLEQIALEERPYKKMKMNSIYASNEEVQPSKQSSSKNETPKKGLTSLSKKKSKNSIRPSASLYDNEQSKHGSISNNLQSRRGSKSDYEQPLPSIYQLGTLTPKASSQLQRSNSLRNSQRLNDSTHYRTPSKEREICPRYLRTSNSGEAAAAAAQSSRASPQQSMSIALDFFPKPGESQGDKDNHDYSDNAKLQTDFTEKKLQQQQQQYLASNRSEIFKQRESQFFIDARKELTELYDDAIADILSKEMAIYSQQLFKGPPEVLENELQTVSSNPRPRTKTGNNSQTFQQPHKESDVVVAAAAASQLSLSPKQNDEKIDQKFTKVSEISEVKLPCFNDGIIASMSGTLIASVNELHKKATLEFIIETALPHLDVNVPNLIDYNEFHPIHTLNMQDLYELPIDHVKQILHGILKELTQYLSIDLTNNCLLLSSDAHKGIPESEQHSKTTVPLKESRILRTPAYEVPIKLQLKTKGNRFFLLPKARAESLLLLEEISLLNASYTSASEMQQQQQQQQIDIRPYNKDNTQEQQQPHESSPIMQQQQENQAKKDSPEVKSHQSNNDFSQSPRGNNYLIKQISGNTPQPISNSHSRTSSTTKLNSTTALDIDKSRKRRPTPVALNVNQFPQNRLSSGQNRIESGIHSSEDPQNDPFDSLGTKATNSHNNNVQEIHEETDDDYQFQTPPRRRNSSQNHVSQMSNSQTFTQPDFEHLTNEINEKFIPNLVKRSPNQSALITRKGSLNPTHMSPDKLTNRSPKSPSHRNLKQSFLPSELANPKYNSLNAAANHSHKPNQQSPLKIYMQQSSPPPLEYSPANEQFIKSQSSPSKSAAQTVTPSKKANQINRYSPKKSNQLSKQNSKVKSNNNLLPQQPENDVALKESSTPKQQSNKSPNNKSNSKGQHSKEQNRKSNEHLTSMKQSPTLNQKPKESKKTPKKGSTINSKKNLNNSRPSSQLASREKEVGAKQEEEEEPDAFNQILLQKISPKNQKNLVVSQRFFEHPIKPLFLSAESKYLSDRIEGEIPTYSGDQPQERILPEEINGTKKTKKEQCREMAVPISFQKKKGRDNSRNSNGEESPNRNLKSNSSNFDSQEILEMTNSISSVNRPRNQDTKQSSFLEVASVSNSNNFEKLFLPRQDNLDRFIQSEQIDPYQNLKTPIRFDEKGTKPEINVIRTPSQPKAISAGNQPDCEYIFCSHCSDSLIKRAIRQQDGQQPNQMLLHSSKKASQEQFN